MAWPSTMPSNAFRDAFLHRRALDRTLARPRRSKEGIGLRAFGQRDPLVEYKMEAFKLFKEMMETIHHDVVSFVFRAGPLVNDRSRKSAVSNNNKRLDRKRLDPNRARSTHASASTPSYGVGSGSQKSARDKDPSAGGQQTVVISERTRNETTPALVVAAKSISIAMGQPKREPFRRFQFIASQSVKWACPPLCRHVSGCLQVLRLIDGLT